jgi:hypothetical protein
MSQSPLDRLLGNDDPDPGCDAGMEVIDQYCEAVRRGEDAVGRFRAFAAHLHNCTACREDTEALLAALNGM